MNRLGRGLISTMYLYDNTKEKITGFLIDIMLQYIRILY